MDFFVNETPHNKGSYCIPQLIVNMSILLHYYYICRQKICIIKCGTQHSQDIRQHLRPNEILIQNIFNSSNLFEPIL